MVCSGCTAAAVIASMIASIGVPYAFDHFGEKDGEHPQGPPFICFLYVDRADLHAAGINYVHIVQLSIELYTDEPDFELEAAAETALTAAELTFERPEQVYIDAERMYQTTYNTEVLLTNA